MDIPSFRAVAFSFGAFVSGCGSIASPPSPEENQPESAWIAAHACAEGFDTASGDRIVVNGSRVENRPGNRLRIGDDLPNRQDLSEWQRVQRGNLSFCIDATQPHSGLFTAYSFRTQDLQSRSRALDPRIPEGMRLIPVDEYETLQKERNKPNHNLWIGAATVFVGFLFGLGRVVEARRRNMIEMAKAGEFHLEDWESSLRWVFPDRFYRSLVSMNGKFHAALGHDQDGDDGH